MWSEVECERKGLTTPAQIWSSTKYCLRWRSPNMLLYPQNEKQEREESQKMVWTSAEGQCAAAYNRELERRKMTLNRLRRLATRWTMRVWLQAGRLQILRRILLKATSMFWRAGHESVQRPEPYRDKQYDWKRRVRIKGPTLGKVASKQLAFLTMSRSLELTSSVSLRS